MRRPLLVFALLVGLHLPFVGKPVHLDDANFLRLAEGAALDPWRPHAVSINWQGTLQPAFEVLSNPPGVAWWLAPVVEAPVWAQHLWMLLWLPLAAWGAWGLGRRFTGRPAEATVLLVGGPLALLAGQSLMPDLPLLACTLAGMAGVTRGSGGAASRRWPWALLLGSAALFRYSGAALIPLAALWPLLRGDRRGAMVLGLAAAAPLGLLLLHDHHAYGQLHLLAMVGFQDAEGAGLRDSARKAVAAVAMLGAAGVLPLLGRGKGPVVGLLAGLVVGAIGVVLSEQSSGPMVATLLACAAGGVTLGATARRPDREAAWLLLWLWGGLVFLLQLRFVAGRYWLPFLAPAVLLPLRHTPRAWVRAAVVATPLLGLALAASDLALARTQHRLAHQVLAEADGQAGLIAGHWGFQHHLQAAGWAPLDDDAPVPVGALLAVSDIAWPQSPAPGACLRPRGRWSEPAAPLLPRVHTAQGGANLHAFVVSGAPPVETYAPWAFGDDPLDTVTLWEGCAGSRRTLRCYADGSSAADRPIARTPFNLMAKPSGAQCNLDCAYCFYLDKKRLYPQVKRPRMTAAVLEAHVRGMFAAQPGPHVVFPWQGGEPTLMGLGFFERVVALQERLCPPGWTVQNTLQTNGVLLDDAWCAFLAERGFLVGLSLDGPRRLHDLHRVDKGGKPTFDLVMRALRRLQARGVPVNTLTVVSDAVSQHPDEVYGFLVEEAGSTVLQLLPLVERVGADGGLAGPPEGPVDDLEAALTPWSVRPQAWGAFLVRIFDRWVTRDLGRVQVQLFEEALGKQMGRPATMCFFTEECGRALIIEHDGDVYSCDHFVYPEHRLGNVRDDDLVELVTSTQQRAFGRAKADLPGQCLRCPVLAFCRGECPKRRFLRTADGEPGLNALCAGYLRFFTHAQPTLARLALALERGEAADAVMAEVRRQQAQAAALGGSQPCPCGSGRKHKRCCGRPVRGRG